MESDPRVWGKNPHLLGELCLPCRTSASSDRAGSVGSPTLLGDPGKDTVPLWAPELGERDHSTFRVRGCSGHSRRLATAGPSLIPNLISPDPSPHPILVTQEHAWRLWGCVLWPTSTDRVPHPCQAPGGLVQPKVLPDRPLRRVQVEEKVSLGGPICVPRGDQEMGNACQTHGHSEAADCSAAGTWVAGAGFQRPTAWGQDSMTHPCPAMGISQAHWEKC